MAEADWMRQIDAVEDATDRVQESLHLLRNWLLDGLARQGVQSDGFLQAIRNKLEALREEVSGIAAKAESARTRYYSGPRTKLLRGMLLTREEYHVAAAPGGLYGPTNELPYATAKKLGLSEHDDYELFCMMCYEDAERYCYINPDPVYAPSDPKDQDAVRTLPYFGVVPEELSLDALRPEQKEFFRRYMPEAFARFRRG